MTRLALLGPRRPGPLFHLLSLCSALALSGCATGGGGINDSGPPFDTGMADGAADASGDAGVPDATMDSATPPMDSATPPMDSATPPMDSATPPMDSATPPMDSATPPMDSSTGPVDMDMDGYTTATDCDDTNPVVNPGAVERCNSRDDDCDVLIDEEAVDADSFFIDGDMDGFGTSSTVEGCSMPIGSAAVGGDCDDSDPGVNPDASETCNSVDDDCNMLVDDGPIGTVYYEDSDGDGFGNPTSTRRTCTRPTGFVTDNTDCDDGAPFTNPTAIEACNGVSDDCDAAIDEGATCPSGCTGGFFAGSSYLFCTFGRSWSAARSVCGLSGYHLVNISSSLENNYVRTQSTGASLSDVWIGGTDSAVADTWVWDSSGEQFYSGGAPVGGAYTNWQSGQPSGAATEECLEMRTTALWNDNACALSKQYVCER